jgi:Uma2 family endonuclease
MDSRGFSFAGGNKNAMPINKRRISYEPCTVTQHQRVSKKLFKIIDKATQGMGELFYAPIDLYIDEKNVFQPDLIYLSEENKKYLTERGIEGPVDLVVEIISPSNSYTDRNQKKNSYLKSALMNIGLLIQPTKLLKSIHQPQEEMCLSFIYPKAEW